ncbi:hypothetical protein ACFE04_010135 [Oxalis oulophora]
MVSPENTTNWIYDCGVIDDTLFLDRTFPAPNTAFNWPVQTTLNASSNPIPSVEIDGSLGDSDGVNVKESGSKKRGRSESCSATSSKACREKLRRDRLNDKYITSEKNELRDEKLRLKTEKERLEQQLKAMNMQPSFMTPPAMPAAFAPQTHGNKMVPFMSYPGVAMWQFMPPASVDTSQDHVLRPPVA